MDLPKNVQAWNRNFGDQRWHCSRTEANLLCTLLWDFLLHHISADKKKVNFSTLFVMKTNQLRPRAGHKRKQRIFNQSEELPRSGWWHVISIEFLRSFVSHHFAGKPVVALQNVSCFLRLRLIPTLVPFKFPVYSRKFKPTVRNFEKKKHLL